MRQKSKKQKRQLIIKRKKLQPNNSEEDKDKENNNKIYWKENRKNYNHLEKIIFVELGKFITPKRLIEIKLKSKENTNEEINSRIFEIIILFLFF